MEPISRRHALTLGAGLAATSIVPARAAVTAADVPPPNTKPESGAALRVLRAAKFVDGDETVFNANTKRYTEQTGIQVRVDYLAWDNMPAQTAVVANTGAGPDIVIGFGPDPHVFSNKLIEVTDIAEYLGKKYGGWFRLAELYGKKWKSNDWIGIPMGGSSGPCVYRISWVKEAGFDKIPTDLGQFLNLCRALKKNGHPTGFALGHALGDGNGYAGFLLWSHGARLVDEAGKVALDSKETRAAIDYARAMQETMIPGTLAWSDPSNNKAYASGEIGLTANGVSIYYAAKTSKDPAAQAIAADTNHAVMPIGSASGPPQTCTTLNAMVFKHTKFPNAAKDYLRFMMEAPQYDPWLTASLGYWSEPLKAYAGSDLWTSDPKLDVFKTAMDTPYYHGYAGPVNEAAGTVYNDFVLVDMFARVVTGESTPDESIRAAVRATSRYYK
ncbi:MAG TPA: extracellular solute-binding protein [Acetobacteraceae bacterium]|jgi:multiple sugar transport system substrate-binding protein|nr:extracellular solute-binding protein [Acetobacteraceae bacterium]